MTQRHVPSGCRTGNLSGRPAAGQECRGERDVTVDDGLPLSGRAEHRPVGQKLRIDGADLLVADGKLSWRECEYRIRLIEGDYPFHISSIGSFEEEIAQILWPPRRLGHWRLYHAPTVSPQSDISRRPGPPDWLQVGALLRRLAARGSGAPAQRTAPPARRPRGSRPRWGPERRRRRSGRSGC